MTADEVRDLIRERIGAGTQVDLARKFGVSGSYLSDVLKGSREPGGNLLEALGLKRVADYVPKRKAKPA
jgi:predicted transcriptional regulator